MRRALSIAVLGSLVLSVCAAADEGQPARDRGKAPERMMQRYDADHDGALTEAELPANLWKALAVADADRDGKLTLEELGAVVVEPRANRRAAYLVQYDTDHDGAVSREEAPLRVWDELVPLDADHDGKVTRAEILAGRPGIAAAGPRPGTEALFEAFDADDDGALAELELPELLWHRLAELDTDHDGRLTEDELKAAVGRQAEVAAQFARFDANGDGVLAADEMPDAAWAKLAAADADHDGKVTRDELNAFTPPPPDNRTKGARAVFARLDKDGDGKLTMAEVPGRQWARISPADQDGDGAVSAEEYRAFEQQGGAGRRTPAAAERAPDDDQR